LAVDGKQFNVILLLEKIFLQNPYLHFFMHGFILHAWFSMRGTKTPVL
jgi:hypothetical protein